MVLNICVCCSEDVSTEHPSGHYTDGWRPDTKPWGEVRLDVYVWEPSTGSGIASHLGILDNGKEDDGDQARGTLIFRNQEMMGNHQRGGESATGKGRASRKMAPWKPMDEGFQGREKKEGSMVPNAAGRSGKNRSENGPQNSTG